MFELVCQFQKLKNKILVVFASIKLIILILGCEGKDALIWSDGAALVGARYHCWTEESLAL